MTDDEASRLKAVTEQYEPFLLGRVIRVSDQTGILVQKDGLRLFKRNTVFAKVGPCLPPVPGKLKIAHSIIVAIRASNREAPPSGAGENGGSLALAVNRSRFGANSSPCA